MRSWAGMTTVMLLLAGSAAGAQELVVSAASSLTDAFREVKLMPAGADAPLRAKLIAGTSLSAWVAVLICGRLITFYRPPFFH